MTQDSATLPSKTHYNSRIQNNVLCGANLPEGKSSDGHVSHRQYGEILQCTVLQKLLYVVLRAL